MPDPAFCERCGAALGRRWDGGRERAACARCGFIVYRNPVPIAVVVARDGERVLLTRRGNEPLRGFWAPPAGYVEIDESAEDAAIRETREETGFAVALDGVRGVYSAPHVGVLAIAYDARVVGGAARPGDEAEEVGLFDAAALPAQPPAHAGTPLDAWFLGLIEDLLPRAAGASPDAAIRERRRQLQERLDALLAEVDAARGEMASADVDAATLREMEGLRRELAALQQGREAR